MVQVVVEAQEPPKIKCYNCGYEFSPKKLELEKRKCPKCWRTLYTKPGVSYADEYSTKPSKKRQEVQVVDKKYTISDINALPLDELRDFWEYLDSLDGVSPTEAFSRWVNSRKPQN